MKVLSVTDVKIPSCLIYHCGVGHLKLEIYALLIAFFILSNISRNTSSISLVKSHVEMRWQKILLEIYD